MNQIGKQLPSNPNRAADIEKLEMARTDYLFGVDGSLPCRADQALARRYDLHINVIRRHSEGWLAELKATAKPLSVLCGHATEPETIDAHEDDSAFLRDEINRLKKKIRDMQDNRVGMEEYAFACRQFKDLQKRWSELMGIENALKTKLANDKLVAKIMIEGAAESEKPKAAQQQSRTVSGAVFDIPNFDDP